MQGVDSTEHPAHWKKGTRYDRASFCFALRELGTLQSLAERLHAVDPGLWGRRPGQAPPAVATGFAAAISAAYDADEYDEHALHTVFAHRWALLADGQAVVAAALTDGTDPKAAVLAWLSTLNPLEDRKEP